VLLVLKKGKRSLRESPRPDRKRVRDGRQREEKKRFALRRGERRIGLGLSRGSRDSCGAEEGKEGGKARITVRNVGREKQ